MTITITQRIVTALAGPAVFAGVLAGAISLGAPANAAPAPSSGMTCTTANVVADSPAETSLLTRPGQLNAARASSGANVSATSCIGH